MPREVTLQELQTWINKNMHHTWNHDENNGVKFEDKTLKAKYIRFSLDTRDMKIFHITCEGFGKREVDFRDNSPCETILDLLDERLNKKKE